MKKKCMCCGDEYLVENSDALFRFQFCTDACQSKTEEEFVNSERYICYEPLKVELVSTKEIVTVPAGSKWKRNNNASNGCAPIHLDDLSGVKGQLEWIEIDEQALAQHFQKIN